MHIQIEGETGNNHDKIEEEAVSGRERVPHDG